MLDEGVAVVLALVYDLLQRRVCRLWGRLVLWHGSHHFDIVTRILERSEYIPCAKRQSIVCPAVQAYQRNFVRRNWELFVRDLFNCKEVHNCWSRSCNICPSSPRGKYNGVDSNVDLRCGNHSFSRELASVGQKLEIGDIDLVSFRKNLGEKLASEKYYLSGLCLALWIVCSRDYACYTFHIF